MSDKHCYRIGPEVVAARDEEHAWEVLAGIYGSVDDFEGEEPEAIPDDEPLSVWCEDLPLALISNGARVFMGKWDHQVIAPARDWANDIENKTGHVSSKEY